MTDDREGPGFDPEALKRKYQAEREKRLRRDGNAQYRELKGQFAHYLDDPYVERVERAPIEKDLDVAILGGGFGGLLAGARLREKGVEDVAIIEKGGDVGGTWYWNRYPGAACDVESYTYLPLLEETGYVPLEKYSKAPEILEHARRIARKFDLYRDALFQTEIKEIRWDEAASRWIVATDRGDRLRARFVIVSSGPLQTPKLPGIPGIETFKGHSFHTSRWDYEYTGGDAYGNLAKLADKRVAIIGTGATAVQCVPHLGRWAKELYVFQRTPSSIGVRGNRPTDPEWAKTLTPGWQKRRMDNFVAVTTGGGAAEDLIDDGWTKGMFAATREMTPDMTPAQIGAMLQQADYTIMEDIRARVDAVVEDKATAEALKPWYNRLCKRPCFHDDYLATFNLPNVTLVDTQGQGVDAITENALVVRGEAYEVDCLIYATGFELAAFTGDMVMPVIGRDGRSIGEKWKDGATTLHGIFVHGFPNFFILSTTQSAWGANFPHMMDEQARHIAYVVGEVGARGARDVEVSEQAERDWVKTHEDHAHIMTSVWAECTPSYFNNEGQASPVILRNGAFGGGVTRFVEILEGWREKGELEGVTVR